MPIRRRLGVRAFWTTSVKETKVHGRVQSEQLDRIRRRLRADPQYMGIKRQPCFAAALHFGRRNFGRRSLPHRHPCSWPATRKSRRARPMEVDRPAGEGKPKRQKVRANRRYTGGDMSEKNQDGVYSLNRKLLRSATEVRAPQSIGKGKCKNQRSRQCYAATSTLGPTKSSSAVKTATPAGGGSSSGQATN